MRKKSYNRDSRTTKWRRRRKRREASTISSSSGSGDDSGPRCCCSCHHQDTSPIKQVLCQRRHDTCTTTHSKPSTSDVEYDIHGQVHVPMDFRSSDSDSPTPERNSALIETSGGGRAQLGEHEAAEPPVGESGNWSEVPAGAEGGVVEGVSSRDVLMSPSLENSTLDRTHLPSLRADASNDTDGVSTAPLRLADDTESDLVAAASMESSSSSPKECVQYALESDLTDCEDDMYDMECYEAHFLEEQPAEEDVDVPPIPDLSDDDPDDPDSGSDEGSRSSRSSGNRSHASGLEDDDGNDDSDDDNDDDADEDNDLADLVNAELNVPVTLENDMSKGQVLLLQLANAVRHSLTFECILDSFRNLNMVFGDKFLPISKKKLWKVIQLDTARMQAHVYCGRRDCGSYIGRKDRLPEIVECNCGYRVTLSKARFFVTLNFKNQLKRLLNLPGIWDKLQYRNTRTRRSPTAIEDVYDGSEYRRLQEDGGPLSSPHSFSYVFNTDGCKPSKRGSLKVWPLFVRINELPPEMRQKFHFLVALYVDKSDPNFQSFLKPFVTEANRLSTEGIRWKPDGVNEVTSTFVPLCHCVDSAARNELLNMAKFNSNFGCTYCTHVGVYLARSMRYPTWNDDGQPYDERTHDTMTESMIQAHQEGVEHMGHKGLTQLVLLRNHDLREGQAADDLHPDHEGCARDITELLLTLAPRVVPGMYDVELNHLVDEKLLSIRTPSRIARKPSSISSMGSYKGSEWRNWLLFFGTPCLTGLIAPEYVDMFSMLSHACYLLSQDVIEPGDTVQADRLLRRYSASFEQRFGRERMKFNLHVTTSHKVNSVRKLGPPWCYSTYNFESLNGRTIRFITSPKGAILQVVTRYLLHQTVNSAMYDDRVPINLRERLKQTLSKDRLQGAYEVQPHTYVIGKCTTRAPSVEERDVLAREGLQLEEIDEYPSLLIGNTRYKSVAGQNPDTRSDDSFVYTSEDTFCTIQSVITFRDGNGDEKCGLFVKEHDVARVLPIARHISVLRDAMEDLLHFINASQVRLPAIKMNLNGVLFAVPVPNCFEID